MALGLGASWLLKQGDLRNFLSMGEETRKEEPILSENMCFLFTENPVSSHALFFNMEPKKKKKKKSNVQLPLWGTFGGWKIWIAAGMPCWAPSWPGLPTSSITWSSNTNLGSPVENKMPLSASQEGVHGDWRQAALV